MKSDPKVLLHFQGRKAILSSMHKKEEAIRPLLKKFLNIDLFVPSNIDTDALGTFSGEIERLASPEETLVKKCELGMNKFGYDLGIASEGSFGPYPLMPFVAINEELVLLMDKKNNWSVFGRSQSFDTNFRAANIETKKELEEFAKKAKFPSHGLILKLSQYNTTDMKKGINDWDTLFNSFASMKKIQNKVWIETDMRAHLNPTRMLNIVSATEDLIRKLNSLCPNCFSPGFSVRKADPGLPCSSCGLPTPSISVHHYQCLICNHMVSNVFPNGKESEDPMYCNFCNP